MVALGGAGVVGCDRAAAPTARTMAHGNEGDIYLQSVSDTLNNIPDALNLNALPGQPILTAKNSTNGKEVRAICIRNPANPDGPINYLQAVDQNAKFLSAGVKAGDVVRYYVNYDAEAAEHDLVQRTALELKVRRLDALDPENVLILDGAGLSAAALDPQRIEIWRFENKRDDAIRSRLNVYLRERRPPAGWEPTPDLGALEQIVERANQWLRNLPEGRDDWKPTPRLAELPVALRDADGVKELVHRDALVDGVFADWEGRLLEQAVWCRDISQWVRSAAASDLDAAAALFDWTVRNIQLDPPASEDAPQAVTIHHPWQALVYGHGTAEHRAWTFIELCRQQGIDAVVLEPKPGAHGEPAPLLVGALIDEELYLFDPALGLPLPGEKQAVGTLAELAGSDALLRSFDVAGMVYPLTAAQLDGATARIAASPLELSRRSVELEEKLEGEDFVKLAVDADELAERVGKLPHIAKAALWTAPFQAIADEFAMPLEPRNPKRQFRPLAAEEIRPFAFQPLLWKARVLHFQGNKGKRAAERDDPLAEQRIGHQDAMRAYQDGTVRPTDAALAQLEPEERAMRSAAKAAASYWVGLLSYDRGNYQVAADWIGERSLDRNPQGKWAPGARYNLARSYEKLGRIDDAIKLLESDPHDAPQRQGNLIRAQQLRAQAAESAGEAAAGGSGA
jgi:tetratricopeptide (TPR) repeat protein